MTARCSPNDRQMYGLMEVGVGMEVFLSAGSFMEREVFGMLSKLAVQQLSLGCGGLL